jgi:endoglucanase
MHGRSILLLATTGAVVAGCITTPASETGGTARARLTVPQPCGPDALIEDAEDGDSQVLVRAGRGGYWYTFVDAYGSTVTPSGPFKMSAPGHSGSKHAARMQGQIASSTPSVFPYAGMAFKIADPGGPYDASRYRGISFWAKGPAHVRFEIPDAYTSPEGGFCKDCYNDFNVELMLTDKWERYTILFEWLAQRQGWGDPRPGLDPASIYALEWEYSTPDRSFDVWLDDIAFVCGAEESR